MNPKLKPWIRWLHDEEAGGLLASLYKAAYKRAGRVWNILRVQSLRPDALKNSLGLYQNLVHSPSEKLDRAARETIAVVVSRLNHCPY